jgi:hypothetical protein
MGTNPEMVPSAKISTRAKPREWALMEKSKEMAPAEKIYTKNTNKKGLQSGTKAPLGVDRTSASSTRSRIKPGLMQSLSI